MKKLALITAVLGGFSLSNALELKTDFLGTLNISGALTGYMLHSNNTSDTKKTRYDVGSALINISKPAEPFGFTLIGGAYATPVVGVGLLKTSDSTDLFSPLPVAYLEYAPIKGLSLQAGKLPTIIGYESAFTYLNNYVQRGLIWNMQPVINNGVRLTYSTDLFTVKVGVNDGFYTLSTTHPKPAFEGSIGITPIKDASLSFNFIIPDKSSRPNDTAFPANKREFNALAAYTFDRLSFGMDFMYVEAPRDAEAGVPAKAKASGGCLHFSYDLKPIKLSGRVEYVKDNSDAGGIDLVGLGDGNKGWTFTLTPAYQKGPLMVRGEVSYVKADNPFTSNNKKSQTRLGLEVGFLF
ncbi:MAG: porin [Aquificaceae bacterium]|uniref:porin n=1 Tax=Hydrogenobacter sp. Uz 6-8 TaxID=3384828 RepID=UPI00309D6BA0